MASRATPPGDWDGKADMPQKTQARRPRTRRRGRGRGRGSIQSYQTAAGRRWRYQIWVPIDPEQPDLGEKKFSRGGFETAADADAALQDALKQRAQHEKFGGKAPTRIARHYRDLEQHGRKDEQDKGGPLSANTVHKAHVLLGAILDAAIEDGHITANPAKRKAAKAPTTSQMRAEKPELVTWTTVSLARPTQ